MTPQIINDAIVLHGDVFQGCAQAMISALAAAGSGDVTIRLNSGGGDAIEGLAMASAIRAHPGVVTVRVEGIAASAASVIALAAVRLEMDQSALLMIHEPAGWMDFATSDEMAAGAAALAKISDSYAEIYRARMAAGTTIDQVRALMAAETWYTAAEAAATFGAIVLDAAAPAAIAAHDYTCYRRAPVELRAAARLRGWTSPQRRAAAIYPDASASHSEEGLMPRTTTQTTAPAAASPADPGSADAACRMMAGADLAALLGNAIDAAVTDTTDRAAVIDAMASAAGIDAGTVDQILAGEINCPPIERLRGFADVLDLSIEQMTAAGESDGCDYAAAGPAAEAVRTEAARIRSILAFAGDSQRALAEEIAFELPLVSVAQARKLLVAAAARPVVGGGRTYTRTSAPAAAARDIPDTPATRASALLALAGRTQKKDA